jgi:hypothetical protein
MLNLASWPFTRVLVIAAAWVALAAVLYGLRVFLIVRGLRGQGGATAVSVGIGPIVLVLFGPPVFLVVIWLGWRLLSSAMSK